MLCPAALCARARSFAGESMDPEAGMALMFHEGDNPNPFFYFFKDGLYRERS